MSIADRDSVFITVDGVVQGVGFRPFVAKLAESFGIKGRVCNSGGIVEISAEGKNIDEFIRHLKSDAPLNSQIRNIITKEKPFENYEDFKIIKSSYGDKDEAPYIPADLSVCDKCIEELYSRGNRRYLHPFISCASCGPRYSIIDTMPYDRCNTAMIDFDMCEKCSAEYNDMGNRRFHAQTVSCHDCGPYLIYKSENISKTKESAFFEAVKALKKGGIVAVKGIGGFHFACSPFDEETVENLRTLKIREEKPFAVMFPDIETLKKYCMVNKEEYRLLNSSARPIVLLLRKKSNIAESVYKDSRFLGAFLPYTPLQHMLLKECGPLIMTSANLSGQPIIKDESEIFGIHSTLLTGVLYNQRAIRTRLDDSVARVADGCAQSVRFSRGYVPLPIIIGDKKKLTLFAAGGDLKASFCILKNGKAYLSQYFGDMEDLQVYDNYEKSAKHLESLLRAEPKAVICDMHPAYFSSSYAQNTGLPTLKVQHHFAHIASVMAEHRLTKSVIGVAFDGTGFGDDGAVWGGEFLICGPKGYERRGHLEYTKMSGGDAIPKDSWRCAMAHLYAAGLEKYIKDDRFDIIKAAVDKNINTFNSSSMGRLFDAVSSILGLSDRNNYEGQSAIILENAAYSEKEKGGAPYPLNFDIEEHDGMLTASPKPVMCGIVDGIEKGISKGGLSLGFHEAAAQMVLSMCLKLRKREGINSVALSGGVFQNVLLFERCLEILRNNDFMVYYNKYVPMNDSGIALGQAYVGANLLD